MGGTLCLEVMFKPSQKGRQAWACSIHSKENVAWAEIICDFRACMEKKSFGNFLQAEQELWYSINDVCVFTGNHCPPLFSTLIE